LLKEQPDLAGQVAEIVIMGGAVNVPGNVGPSSDIDNEAAEWNLYVDPVAARLVFQSGAPISLVPLDATNDAPATIELLRRLEKDRVTPAADFVSRFLATREDDLRAGYYYFWDPLAAAAFTDPEIVRYEEMTLAVETSDGPESGNTYTSDDGAPVQVAVSADGRAFEDLFVQVLNGRFIFEK
jgi:inosine-uridine nucleoside N-ribohydrolase